jgi:hypothetical protein
MKHIALVLVLLAAPAGAATLRELDPDALVAGAERIVDATVVARTTRWNATHTGLETVATLAVEATWKGAPVSTLAIVVPGGELDGARHVIVGMPAVAVGERARWFLRDRGDGELRVYGWAQGVWPARIVDGVTRFAPAPVAAEHPTTVAAFATNGMVWPAAKQPVPYLIQSAGSQDVTLAQELAAIDAAFATWQAIPCASLAFTNAGMTNLGLAVDDKNVILFVESNWQFGSEAAAATSLWIIDGEQTADIAINGQGFTWAIGPPGDGITSKTLDLQAVLTHEIGHFSGLDHSMRSYDTMYFSWKPWPGQRTLSIDDKLGLCSVYPVAGDECPTTACPTGETCTQHPLGQLCEGTPDPIGTPCNYDRVECEAFCLFTAVNLSTGYCSRFCNGDFDCPPTHHCAAASAGTSMVKVCFAGPPVLVCADETDCPGGEYCDTANNTCTFDCRADADCGGSPCDEHGRCATAGDGGCCQSGDGGGSVVVLALLALSALGRARSRSRSGCRTACARARRTCRCSDCP